MHDIHIQSITLAKKLHGNCITKLIEITSSSPIEKAAYTLTQLPYTATGQQQYTSDLQTVQSTKTCRIPDQAPSLLSLSPLSLSLSFYCISLSLPLSLHSHSLLSALGRPMQSQHSIGSCPLGLAPLPLAAAGSCQGQLPTSCQGQLPRATAKDSSAKPRCQRQLPRAAAKSRCQGQECQAKSAAAKGNCQGQ